MPQHRVRNVVLGGLIGLLLASGLFGAGVAVGNAFPIQSLVKSSFLQVLEPSSSATATYDPNNTPVPPQTQEELFQPFWDAWRLVHDEYVDPVDDVQLMRGAIGGMLDSLGDPHTGYMNPDEYRQANIPLEGSYEGIGAWVDTDGEYLTIISPMPNSPAEDAGLESGDEIIAIDGEDMTGVEGNQVIRQVMGPAGSTVTLTVRREGEPEPFDVEVERREITVPSVESRMLDNGIAYLHLYNFGEDTTRDMSSALDDLMSQNPKGLILDLRGNGGGFLGTAVNVGSEFLSGGTILTERFGDGTEQTYDARRGGSASDIPLVVLINGGSASASEIVAGAIQDRGRGQLVGTTSFGKGSVQEWIPLSSDGGAVRVTIARWYTPDDRQISEKGLTPDVVVEMTDEDIQAGNDPQLDRAVELLQDEAAR
ncbi:MAG: S41 family peptidase [Anaerolineales bacterium]